MTRKAHGTGELAWEAVGAGAPVILLHGFSFDLGMWDRQVPELARAHRVFRYDLRGFGRSSLPSGPYSHVEDVLALMDLWSVGSATLIGLSLGANIALELAAFHPERVERMVLASPGLPGHVWTGDRPPDAAARIARADGADAAKAFWMSHLMFESVLKSEAAGDFAAMLDRYHGWHWRNADPRAPAADLAQRLSGIAAPTLVVSGGQDIEDYRQIARRVAAEIPGAVLEVLVRAGHVMPLEAPDRFNALLAGFLAGPANKPSFP
jgi:pimeloyl-ACP methyl ester carboxylesterase